MIGRVALQRRRRWSGLLAAALMVGGLGAGGLPTPAWAGPYSNVFVFGDSLSDAGNVFVATGGAVPVSPPYFQGRFSNGPTYAADLATRLGVQATPSLLGGTNFAFGGAWTSSAALGD